MHYKGVLTRMWRSLELCFESLDVEGRFAGFAENRFVKRGKCEWRNGHPALLAIRKENEPARRMVTCEIRSVRKRWGDRLIINRRCFDIPFRILCLDCFLAAENGVEITLVRINVFQIKLVDLWNVGRTRWNKPCFDDELH